MSDETEERTVEEQLRTLNASLNGIAQGLLGRAMRAEYERDRLEASLKREETWFGGPDAEPLPTLVYEDGNSYWKDALGGLHPFEPTDEEMLAAGWVKKVRWISEWKDVP